MSGHLRGSLLLLLLLRGWRLLLLLLGRWHRRGRLLLRRLAGGRGLPRGGCAVVGG
jgi:hypothetical protein